MTANSSSSAPNIIGAKAITGLSALVWSTDWPDVMGCGVVGAPLKLCGALSEAEGFNTLEARG